MLRTTGDATFLDRAPGGGPISMMYSGISQAREFDDPPGLYEKTEFLLREWVNMYHAPNAGRDSTKAFSLFVHQVSSNTLYIRVLGVDLGLKYSVKNAKTVIRYFLNSYLLHQVNIP